ncbi:MAG: ACP S-malonyltransferase [Deltaproteobacteria bacterium]|nr:ACP S-malonyltransferase [Deltaproteobacteria bacterium]MBW2419952.1 ACP S-malonyltransferase [Deltaproteobacteria bacterium]
MGRDAYEASPAARAVFEAADSALDFSLSQLCFEGPDEELRRTEIQQPAILTVSIALLRALEEGFAVEPAFVAGHSLGEYSALVAAGALDFEQAVRLVHARGRFMQEAVPEGVGAMAAVLGSTPESVAEACAAAAKEKGEVVSPANFNSPAQTVIAGAKQAVQDACERALEQGAKKTVSLPVSAPFHCALMAPAAERLEAELAGISFRDASPPVVTNVEAKANTDGTRTAALLKEQVTAAVRFTDMVEELTSLGADHFLEVGPGRVLSGLLARIQRRVPRANLSGIGDLEEARSFVEAGQG